MVIAESPAIENIFQAILFKPEVAPSGMNVKVAFLEDGFSIDPEPLKNIEDVTGRTIPYSTLEMEVGGFDHRQMLLSFSGGALALVTQEARLEFMKCAAPYLHEPLIKLRQQMRDSNRKTSFGWIVIAFMMLIPVFLAALFFLNADRLTHWMIDKISIDTEVRLGNLIYAQMQIGQTPIPALEQPMGEIGKRLVKVSPYPFQWHVVKNPAVNAFAIPGGHIVIFTGLIHAADSTEEIAGVLAHEVQHILQRHTLQAVVNDIGLSALIRLVLGGGNLTNIATQMGALKFGRDQEREADIEGLRLLKEAQISPAGMMRFFERLGQQEGFPSPWLSTHPDSRERATSLRQTVARMGQWNSVPLPYSIAALKEKGPL